MKLHQLKELVKQVVREEEDYQQLFKHMLDKSGKSIPSMSDDEKKKFFNAVDTAYKAKSEGRLRGYNEEQLNEKSFKASIGRRIVDVGGQSKEQFIKYMKHRGLIQVFKTKDLKNSDYFYVYESANEGTNEEEIKWNAVENAIINFLKMNTKILDKRVKDRDTDGVKGGLQSIIDGLTNAQRSLKLK